LGHGAGFELPGFELPGFELPGFELPGFELPGFEFVGVEEAAAQGRRGQGAVLALAEPGVAVAGDPGVEAVSEGAGGSGGRR
jgi:hypothetical protein